MAYPCPEPRHDGIGSQQNYGRLIVLLSWPGIVQQCLSLRTNGSVHHLSLSETDVLTAPRTSNASSRHPTNAPGLDPCPELGHEDSSLLTDPSCPEPRHDVKDPTRADSP